MGSRTVKNLVTFVHEVDYERIVDLLDGTGMTPVRWLGLIARHAIENDVAVTKAENSTIPHGAPTVRLVATIPSHLRLNRTGRMSEAAWARAQIWRALESKFVPVDPRQQKTLSKALATNDPEPAFAQ